MHRRGIRSLLPLVALFVVSCEGVPEGIHGEAISILGRVENGVTRPKIYVYRIAGLQEQLSSEIGYDPGQGPFLPYLIDDAMVSVVDGHGTVYPLSLHIDSVFYTYDSVRYYNILKSFTTEVDVPIIPAATYTLHVVTPTSEAKGQTTVPGNFSLLSPDASSVLTPSASTSGINVSWSPSSSSFGYMVILTRITSDRWRGRYEYSIQGSARVTDSSTVVWPPDLLVGDSLRIEVVAVDRNYYRHVYEAVDHSGLTGAHGYFGSGVRKSITLRVQ